MKNEFLTRIADAGTTGISGSALFAPYKGGRASLTATNTLVQMRRNGEVAHVRGGDEGGLYYLPENAPVAVGEGN